MARAPLGEVGLDYLHGTGHGVGAFLNVHEGPCGINARPSKGPLQAGMILSDGQCSANYLCPLIMIQYTLAQGFSQ